MPLTFSPITDSDRDFLFTLYASTRADELAMVPWGQEQKTEFLEMQFHAQHTFYQEQFADAEFNLILNGKTAIGRLYVDRRDEEIRIIDIALLPDHRRQGFGKQLLQNLLDEAATSQKPVTIHVEKNNLAMSLYQRLGFEITEDQGVYNLMRWQIQQS